ncbi:MAG: YggS family pyridoxal phosphate-dependent enzyme [Desulfobacterota bacterium]|nr:YggS family pyridoxal phosphate-dependent enzyme [Thermodesulfobacteriota bacterium]
MGEIADNIARIKERIYKRAIKVGRDPQTIILIGASKSVSISYIKEAIAAGISIFGENYVQEAKEKISQIKEKVSWHMIGHLQKNKVKNAISLFSMIQSVDSLELAREISVRAIKEGKIMEILIQVNVGEERTKSGIKPLELEGLLRDASTLKGIKVKGLMTIPPYFPEAEKGRPFFQKLRELRDKLLPYCAGNISLEHLSMGMSGDFEVAIEEGATILRIGTAIFGERK